MKRSIITTLILLSLGSVITSCKKDYVCKCSKTYTTGSGSSTSEYSHYTYKDNRKRAEDRCNANEATSSDLFGDYSINCEIQ